MDFRRVMGMVPATCTYWKNASCFKGDRCTFFHGFICRDDGVCSDQTCDKSHFKQKDPAITKASGVSGQSYQRQPPPFLKNSVSTPPIITSTTTTTTTIRRPTENQGQPILIPHQVQLQAQQSQQTRAPAFKPSIQHYKRSDRSRSRSRSYSPRRRRHSSSRSPSPRGDRDRSRSYRHKKSERDSYYDSKDSSRRSKFKPIGEPDSYRSIDETSSKDRDSSYHRSSSSKSYDSKSYSKDSSRRRSHSREK
ncbi:UNVERIFIED_CONTAM: hypothetical protein RMT77_007485 [Armadillidium vulgare]